MHVVGLGAGVVGITAAYYLCERGHRVTVVERADAVASGASAGNGGQLSYSFTDAMASPALLTKIPKMMTGLDPAFFVRPPLDTNLFCWGQAFSLKVCFLRSFRYCLPRSFWVWVIPSFQALHRHGSRTRPAKTQPINYFSAQPKSAYSPL